MGVNSMDFTQAATILRTVVEQATGQQNIATIDESNFVSVAQSALLSGYDPMMTAISQVLSSTIFSVRPYYAKLRGLQVDNERFGAHVRKINMIDPDIENDSRLAAIGNTSIDMYQAQQMKAVQTNFYGANTYERGYKIYRDQIDSAFTSSGQFANFIAAWVQNATDSLEQYREQFTRIALLNFVGGIAAGNGGSESIIHVLTEYKAATGNSTITAANYKSAAEFPDFVKWLYARINTAMQFLSERTELYHAPAYDVNGNAATIMRHTPRQDLRVYLNTELSELIATSVMSAAFNERFLTIGDYDTINYWQSPSDPLDIQVTGSYETGTGVGTFTYDTSGADAPVLGVLMDREAAGLTYINQWDAVTPFNSRGGYTVDWYHETVRWWNDFTENGIVLVLD